MSRYSKYEKEQRSLKAYIEGKKTKEGRLKIEAIESYQHEISNGKINVIFDSCVGAFNFILALLSSSMVKDPSSQNSLRNINIVCGIICVGCAIFNIHEQKKKQRKIERIEDEILDKKGVK